jgi:hypothetical protein
MPLNSKQHKIAVAMVICCSVYILYSCKNNRRNIKEHASNQNEALKEVEHNYKVHENIHLVDYDEHANQVDQQAPSGDDIDSRQSIDDVKIHTKQENSDKQIQSNDKDGDVPIILFYEQHPLYWFSPFDLRGSCTDHCIFTNNTRLLNKSNAVILFRSLRKPPPRKLTNQKWIYFTNESPAHIGPILTNTAWKRVAAKFDWLMSYRPRSDIVFSFGNLTKSESTPYFDYSKIFAEKTKDVVWLVSHCDTNSKRELYVKELQKYISVDIYGKCGNKNCTSPIHKAEDFTSCKSFLSLQYKFYLSFENSLCDNYVSEKVYGVYGGDNMMIPVVRSAPNSASFLPTGTYISTSGFKSPKQLAEYLKEVGSSEEKYISILKEKHKYKLIPWMENYKQTICNLCKMLKSPSKNRNVVGNIYQWLSEDKCHRPNDIPEG